MMQPSALAPYYSVSGISRSFNGPLVSAVQYSGYNGS
ncbi:hypothetical protein BN440_1424 [Erwinia amylovora MR1]|nr:hypothetical protein BN440_1424 [Erwinia amylovora MR1]